MTGYKHCKNRWNEIWCNMSWSKCNATVTFPSLSHFTSIATGLVDCWIVQRYVWHPYLEFGCSSVHFHCVFLTFWHCTGFIGLALLEVINQTWCQLNYQHVYFNEESSPERFLCDKAVGNWFAHILTSALNTSVDSSQRWRQNHDRRWQRRLRLK